MRRITARLQVINHSLLAAVTARQPTIDSIAMECSCGEELLLCGRCTTHYCSECSWEDSSSCARCDANYCANCCALKLTDCNRCKRQYCSQCFPIVPNFVWDEWNPAYGAWMPVCNSCVDVSMHIDEMLYRRQTASLLIKKRKGAPLNVGRRHDSRRAQFRRELC